MGPGRGLRVTHGGSLCLRPWSSAVHLATSLPCDKSMQLRNSPLSAIAQWPKSNQTTTLQPPRYIPHWDDLTAPTQESSKAPLLLQIYQHRNRWFGHAIRRWTSLQPPMQVAPGSIFLASGGRGGEGGGGVRADRGHHLGGELKLVLGGGS